MTIRALNDKTQELFEGSLKTCQDAFQAEMDWLQEAAGVTLTWCVWFRLWTLRRFLKVLPCDREANKMPVEQVL